MALVKRSYQSPALEAVKLDRAGRPRLQVKTSSEPLEALLDLALLRSQIDDLEAHLVGALVAAGYSWADLGALLGVSRSAAYQRYASRIRS